jgi:hypothetical protein
MIIEPDGDGFKVVGRPKIEAEAEVNATGAKRQREEETGKENKRVKLDDTEEKDQPIPVSQSSAVTAGTDLPQENGVVETNSNEPTTSSTGTKGKGDIFLAEGVRDKLASALDVSPLLRPSRLMSGADSSIPPIRSHR